MQSRTSSRCTSALAVALAVMSAAALDTGITNDAAAASIDNVIGALHGGRRLQGEKRRKPATHLRSPREKGENIEQTRRF